MNPKAMVKCYVCERMFDRANEPYVQKQRGKTFRYAHPDCEPDQPVCYPEDRCAICGKADKVFKVDWLPNTTLKAHEECLANYHPDDKQQLIDYCRSLFGKNDLSETPILHQIKVYKEQNHYGYSAMRKTLMWWYEIEGNDISKANGNIRIIPYIIDRAKAYWKTRESAVEVNKDIDIKPTENITVKLKTPQRQRFHTLDLSFLEEDVDGE